MASLPELIALAQQAKVAYQVTNQQGQALRSVNEAMGASIAAAETSLKEIMQRMASGVTAIQGEIQKLAQANRDARGATLRAFSSSSTGTAGPKISALHGQVETRVNEIQSMLEGAKSELSKVSAAHAALQGARQSLGALNGRADQAMTAAGAQIQAAEEAIARLHSV